jgi:pentafunctional AROM polypeptide
VSTLRDHQWGKILVLGTMLAHGPHVRNALSDYGRHQGPVIQITREIEPAIDYLRSQAIASEQLEYIIQGWSQLDEELRETATFVFPSVQDTIRGQDWHSWRLPTGNDLSEEQPTSPSSPLMSFVNQDLLRLLRFIRGTYTNHVPYSSSARSYYLALTFDRVQLALPLIDELSIGIDCWELRADLLANRQLDSIIRQVALLRRFSDLPIIFSLRARSQAGSLPEPADDGTVIDYIFKASMAALKMGVEYVDVSSVLPRHLRSALIENKGNTRIIASWQDFKGSSSWQADEARLRSFYIEACTMGADVVMMVNLARDNDDNLAVRQFVNRVQRDIPLIAFNVGMAVRIPVSPFEHGPALMPEPYN